MVSHKLYIYANIVYSKEVIIMSLRLKTKVLARNSASPDIHAIVGKESIAPNIYQHNSSEDMQNISLTNKSLKASAYQFRQQVQRLIERWVSLYPNEAIPHFTYLLDDVVWKLRAQFNRIEVGNAWNVKNKLESQFDQEQKKLYNEPVVPQANESMVLMRNVFLHASEVRKIQDQNRMLNTSFRDILHDMTIENVAFKAFCDVVDISEGDATSQSWKALMQASIQQERKVVNVPDEIHYRHVDEYFEDYVINVLVKSINEDIYEYNTHISIGVDLDEHNLGWDFNSEDAPPVEEAHYAGALVEFVQFALATLDIRGHERNPHLQNGRIFFMRLIKHL